MGRGASEGAREIREGFHSGIASDTIHGICQQKGFGGGGGSHSAPRVPTLLQVQCGVGVQLNKPWNTQIIVAPSILDPLGHAA